MIQDNAPRPYFRPFSYADIPENLSPCSDKDASSDFWMAVPSLFSRAPQGHLMQKGNIIAHHGGFSDDDAGCMVDQDAFSDPCRRMNIDRKNLGDPAIQKMRKTFSPPIPKDM